MRALITGSTGFIGCHLWSHLIEQGDQVLGCASRSNSHRNPQFLSLKKKASNQFDDLLLWDIQHPLAKESDSYQQILDFEPDCIFHLAGLSIPSLCGKEEPTPDAVAVNVQGTKNVLSLAKSLAKSLPHTPRVLTVSSCHVYDVVSSAEPVVCEESPLNPRNGYGKTKQLVEEITKTACAEDDLDCVIVRSFHHIGPGQSEHLMLAEWAKQFATTCVDPVSVRSLDVWLDLTDVRDAVRAYRLLMEHGKTAELYNVGSGVSQRSGDVFLALRKLADANRPYQETTPGSRQEPIANIEKLTNCTGWKPEIPLKQTLSDTVSHWVQILESDLSIRSHPS